MIERRTFALSCSAILLTFAVRASADPDPNALKQAQERFREADRLASIGQYEAARVAYQQSIVFVPHGATYRNLATIEMKLGDPVSALKHLRLALSAADLSPAKKTVTKKDFDAAYAATGHIAVSTAAGATLTVDGNPVDGTAPFADAIDVKIARHTFEAHLGAQSAKFEVDAKGGEVTSIELAIAPQPSSAPIEPEPPAPLASAAVVPESPPPSSHAFWNTRREVGLVVGAAGVLALGASAIFLGEANSQGSKANLLAGGLSAGACAGSQPPSACGQLQSAHNSQKTDSTLSGVFLGVGATAVVAGAAMFLWPSSSSSSASAVVPFFSPQACGLQLRQEF